MRTAITLTTLLVTFLPFTSAEQLQEGSPDTQQPSPQTPLLASNGVRQLIVPAGDNLRVIFEKGFRLTGPGELVVAKLTEPLYLGQDIVVDSGAVVSGRVSLVVALEKRVRLGRVLDGDFTPPRLAKVTFDQITLPDGTKLPIYSEATVGKPEMKPSMYHDNHDRTPLKARLTQQAHDIIKAPNKLQRLTEAAARRLPYHPEYIDQGTVYDATLLQPLTLSGAEHSNGPGSVKQTAVPGTVTCGTLALNIALAVARDGTIYSITRAHFNSRYPFLVAINPNLTKKWVSSLRERFSDGCGVSVASGGILPPNGAPGGCRTGANLGVDPATNQKPGGRVLDDSSSSPTVGPDGSIFYGAYTRYNYAQGHMMKWDRNGTFLTAYIFGWDETPAIFSRGDNNSQGNSDDQGGGAYSLVIKDNHYGGVGSYCNTAQFCPTDRDTRNPASPTQLFITQLDQNLHIQWQFKSTNTESCKRNPDGTITCVSDHPHGFEWCVNGHLVDANGVVYANSEDGNLYAINQGGTLKQRIFQQLALGAAYTPTSMDASGRIYSQNAGHLFVVGRDD